MLTVFIYFLPLVVCLVWLTLYKFTNKNLLQNMLMKILYFGVIYSFFFAIYIAPFTNYMLLAYIDGVSMALTLIFLPYILRYIAAHLNNNLENWKYKNILYLPALIFSCFISVLYYLYGFENAADLFEKQDAIAKDAPLTGQIDAIKPLLDNRIEQLFYYCQSVVYAYISGVFLILILSLCCYLTFKLGYKFGDAYKFFFKGKATLSSRTVSLCMIIMLSDLSMLTILHRPYLVSHEYISICISILFAISIFFLCYVEYFNTLPIITLHSLSHIDITIKEGSTVQDNISNDISENDEVSEQKEIDIIQSMSDASRKWSAEHSETSKVLLKKLNKYVIEEKAYKNPMLTREIVAEHLNTNRTTLSFALNILMDTTFKNYLADIRIKESKKYMLKNPTSTLDYVADECGFRDAASFGHKFKELEGVSPKMWLVRSRKMDLQ